MVSVLVTPCPIPPRNGKKCMQFIRVCHKLYPRECQYIVANQGELWKLRKYGNLEAFT
jgi:hypothetical protein